MFKVLGRHCEQEQADSALADQLAADTPRLANREAYRAITERLRTAGLSARHASRAARMASNSRVQRRLEREQATVEELAAATSAVDEAAVRSAVLIGQIAVGYSRAKAYRLRKSVLRARGAASEKGFH